MIDISYRSDNGSQGDEDSPWKPDEEDEMG